MFHYSGTALGAVRHGDFKVHLGPGGKWYNVRRDPGERVPEPASFAAQPLRRVVVAHDEMVRRFPHRTAAAAEAAESETVRFEVLHLDDLASQTGDTKAIVVELTGDTVLS
mmetsp:Transcript_13844/g.48193  ORF Transcript_13844/g.48193 Transcript_13844/m.48193 type:complete len:111 (+) Transcript_13844:330-662(+)